jgi:hypothetical protein
MSVNLTNNSGNSSNIYRDTGLTNVVVTVSDSASELRGWNIINPNSSDVYVKFCDVATSGTTTIGTTAVVKTLHIPANGSVYLENNVHSSQQFFSLGMQIYCVTGLADSNTTAPTTAIHCEINYE